MGKSGWWLVLATWCALVGCRSTSSPVTAPPAIPAPPPVPVPQLLFPSAKTFLIMNNAVSAPVPGVAPPVSGAAWMETHADIGMTGGKSSRRSVFYVNWWDNNAPQLDDTFKFLDGAARDGEDAYLHYAQDALIPVRTGSLQCANLQRWSAMKENRFPAVLLDFNNQRVPSRSASMGQALWFSGAGSYADLGPGIRDAVARSGEISIEAWVRPELPGASAAPVAILGGQDMPGLWIDQAHQLVMEVKAPSAADTRVVSPRSPMSKTAPAWYHVVGTASNRTRKVQLFVNGMAVGATPLDPAHPFVPPGANLLLAKDLVMPGSFFRGAVDDIRIYDRELSPAEAAARFADSGPSDRLIAHYDLEDMTDEVLADRSSLHYQAPLLHAVDITDKAYGDIPVPGTSVCSQEAETPSKAEIQMNGGAGQGLYIGNHGPFDEINWNVNSPAGGGWRGALEFWDGEGWMPLASVSDSTGGWLQPGKTSFAPPRGWARTSILGRSRYWLRLRATNAGIAPVFTSSVSINNTYEWKGTSAISGQAYSKNPEGTHFVVRGWDPANDRNGDGYVDPGELSVLANPQASARFRREARVPAAYFSNRWLSNPADPGYQAAIGEFSRRSLSARGMEGLFVDNSVGTVADHFQGGHPILELAAPAGSSAELKAAQNSAYSRSMAAGLAALRRAVNDSPDARRIVLTNGTFYNPSVADADRIMAEVDGTFIEQAITYLSQRKDLPDSLRLFGEKIRKYSALGKMLILHAAPDPEIYGNPAYRGERDQLYALARYYLTSTPQTYFDYQDGSRYLDPWNDWFDAIRVDIGSPLGEFTSRELAPSAVIDPARNLLGRSSFEEYGGGAVFPGAAAAGAWMHWLRDGQVANAANTCKVAESGLDGLKSFLIEQTSVTQDRCAAVQYLNTNAAQGNYLKPNTVYTLSGSIRLENFQSSESSSALLFFYVPGTSSPTATLAGISSPWTRVQVALTTPADVANARVYAHAAKGTGRVWFDQLGLYEGDFVPVQILERSFSKGVVLLRPSKRALANHLSPIDERPVTVSLPDSYCPVHADGRLGAAVRSVALAEFQGFVGVKCP